MKYISLFLTSSLNKEWKWLDLDHCGIQDKGLNILYHRLRHCSDVTINSVKLSSNGLTTQSSSLISELTVKCKVKKLWINANNTIGEEQQLYSMLTNPCSVLEILNMGVTRLSSRAATDLFAAVKDNNKLQELYITYNAITDDACDAIATALKRNNYLVILSMYSNPLSSKAILNIVQSLKVNDTLRLLGLPKCPENIKENIRSLQKVVNKKRASRGCQAKVEIKFEVIL